MKTHDLELCEGQQGRLVFTITAPPGTDTTLRGAVFADPKELLPLPMVAEGENALVIPATQAGYHHYEVRAGGATILYGVLRTLPSPLVPPGAAGWDIDVDMTQELPHVDVGLLQGPQGPQGEPGASAYEAAVAAGYEGTEEEFNAAMAALPQDAAAAAQSAADAAASQEAAAGSAQAAAASAEAASGSAAAAADSASTASTQAGVATAQATAAAESAETATTQATAAGQSATAAAGSATDAGNSATAAAGSASDAAASASDAATDAATATAQATEATTQAGNAAASATTASQQATAAGNSASAAAGSATTASTKATEAAGSASTAATKATEAANSASAAAQSAADAAESAELLGDAALQGRNNTFTQTNTFNGAVALNGPIQGSGAVGGSVLAADEAVAFGIGKGFFERDSRVAPPAPYVLYGPNTDSQPALLSMPTVPASSAEREKVYNGSVPPRYMVLRGNWPANAFGSLTQTGRWNWTTTKEVDEVHIYWPGQTASSSFFSGLHTRRLVLDLPNLSGIKATGSLSGSTAREIVAITPALVSISQTSSGLIHFGNGFNHDVSIDWTAENLTTLSGHVFPATYQYGASKVVGCRLRWPSLSSAPDMFQWGSKFSTVPQADWYYTLSYLPDWTESTTEAYRTAIAQYNAANPETPITVEADATLAELYAAVQEHNTQYPDSKCTVTQPHPIGLAAVENCYAAVAQWLDDGGIPYTREPGHAPVAVLPYGWSISYQS